MIVTQKKGASRLGVMLRCCDAILNPLFFFFSTCIMLGGRRVESPVRSSHGHFRRFDEPQSVRRANIGQREQR